MIFLVSDFCSARGKKTARNSYSQNLRNLIEFSADSEVYNKFGSIAILSNAMKNIFPLPS